MASSTVRIAPQWERVVVLRLGKFNRIDGPGLYVVVPIVKSVAARVDQRIITTPFSAEEAVTADLVPLGIDAVLFWMIWGPKDAAWRWKTIHRRYGGLLKPPCAMRWVASISPRWRRAASNWTMR